MLLEIVTRHASALVVALSIMSNLTGCDWLQESEYSNCAIAEDEGTFTGEWLKNDGNADVTRQYTEECKRRDQEIDDGNGPRAGKVRWTVCLKGPDCDEAGMF